MAFHLKIVINKAALNPVCGQVQVIKVQQLGEIPKVRVPIINDQCVYLWKVITLEVLI